MSKITLSERCVATKSLGFARPETTITLQPILKAKANKKGDYITATIAGEKFPSKLTFGVEEMMCLEPSPIVMENGKPTFDSDEWLVTVPADRDEPVTFNKR